MRPAVLAALILLGLAACGETADSYCGALYRDGGGTPKWARDANLFSDYQSCVEWYEHARRQAR